MMPRTGIIAMIEKPSVTIYYARCVKCGGIIADNLEPIEASGLKPEDIRSMRIKCHHRYGREACGHINFVSHV